METPPEPNPEPSRKIARRKVIRRTLLGALGVGGAVPAFAAFIEPYRPRLSRVDIPIPQLPPALDGLRIAHISDLHIQDGFPAERLKSVVARINELQPDLVAITGDYVNIHSDPTFTQMAPCVAELAKLKAKQGLFAVFGNHDFPPPPADPDRTPWRNAGIETLCDEIVVREIRGVSFAVVGLRSYVVRPVWPGPILERAKDADFRLVLWHEPDRARESALTGGSLQLSGHTHGGQVVLPGQAPSVLPIGGMMYPSGRFLIGVEQMPLYVSRGIGLLPPKVRFNCPPEIGLLTLRRRDYVYPGAGQRLKGR